MALVWNWFGVPGVLFAFFAFGLAGLVYFARPQRSQNRRLAVLLAIEGASVGFGLGLLYFFDTRADAYATMVLRHATLLALPALNLLFVATFATPVVSPLRKRWSTRALITLALLAPLIAIARPSLFIRGLTPVPYAAWECVCAAEPTFLILSLTLIFGLIAAASAFRGALDGSVERRHSGAILLAFGVRDGLLIPIFFISSTLFSFDRFGERPVFDFVWLQGQTIVLLLYASILSYGILKTQLFDIDLKIKIGLRRSTVAAAFVAAFFAVSEGAASLAADRTGSTLLGIGAASILVFFLAPLQRLAERFSDAAMPSVNATPDYLRYRKFEVYRHALESATTDGIVSPKERGILEVLRRELAISPIDAEALERDVLKIP